MIAPKVWQVGALCRAIADALEARFNPIAVSGEISGFTRAASGHCYLSLKDEGGQIRCAMFRRAASLLDFAPRDGDHVEVRGKLGVYEPRGELQLVVESMRRAGQGTLFEQFLLLKEKLEREGLFDARRKRPLPPMPRGIGLVTSLGAAALHDVATALQRRVPHIPVVLAPASVQGEGAPGEIAQALRSLFALATGTAEDAATATESPTSGAIAVEVILLVRGGGSMEDLWAFNDEQLARTIAASPVPVVCGIGHETDFTIADFVADVRAPTPTAAAEMVSYPTQTWLDAMDLLESRLRDALGHALDRQAQRLDRAAARLSRPSDLAQRAQLRLTAAEHRLARGLHNALQRQHTQLEQAQRRLPESVARALQRQQERCQRAGLRLELLDPALVLRRGYAWLAREDGAAISSVTQVQPGQPVHATLADGGVELRVISCRQN